jgi:hypothetical protein
MLPWDQQWGQSIVNHTVIINSSRFRHASMAFDSGTPYLYRVFTGNETGTQPVDRANKTVSPFIDYSLTS